MVSKKWWDLNISDPKKFRQMSGVKISNLFGTNNTGFEKVCQNLLKTIQLLLGRVYSTPSVHLW